MNKQFFISMAIFGALIFATILVVMYGKGYRFGLGEGKVELKGTGLLVAKSIPDGASVFVNDKLQTATNNTINLAPGTYNVKITKEGYFPWEKTIVVQNEVVSRAEALLVPSAPKLESITDIGAQNPVIDPTFTKLAFIVASQSATRNGIYVYNMANHPLLTLQSSAAQIVDDSFDLFSSSKISWSPDGKDLIATLSGQFGTPISYLLDTDRVNSPPNNVSASLLSVQTTWNRLKLGKDLAVLNSLPPKARKLTKENFDIKNYSPDENKILYQASRSADLPIVLKPRIIGANPTQEERSIKKGSFYIYDVKEDRNYKMDDSNFKGAYSWFTDSRHIIYAKDKELHIMEYDGLNDTIVFAGPFVESYLFPWPDGTRVVILTNLGNSKILPNLYTISFK